MPADNSRHESSRMGRVARHPASSGVLTSLNCARVVGPDASYGVIARLVLSQTNYPEDQDLDVSGPGYSSLIPLAICVHVNPDIQLPTGLPYDRQLKA